MIKKNLLRILLKTILIAVIAILLFVTASILFPYAFHAFCENPKATGYSAVAPFCKALGAFVLAVLSSFFGGYGIVKILSYER